MMIRNISSRHKSRQHGLCTQEGLGSELVSAIRAVYHGGSFLYPSAATALIQDYRLQALEGDSYDQLTPREREVLKLIAEGHTSREIAEMLFISLKTVMGHRAKIMEKLGCITAPNSSNMPCAKAY